MVGGILEIGELNRVKRGSGTEEQTELSPFYISSDAIGRPCRVLAVQSIQGRGVKEPLKQCHKRRELGKPVALGSVIVMLRYGSPEERSQRRTVYF